MKKTFFNKKLFYFFFFTICWTGFSATPILAENAAYLGHKKKKGCTKCHREQYKSWKKTPHGRAMKSLKPMKKKSREKKRAAAIIKAGLDPKKNYSKDKDCIGCHTTGYEKGGFAFGSRKKYKMYSNVGCESCHGPGEKYLEVKNKYEDNDFPREEVITAGLEYGQEKFCLECHNDDSPFNAELDAKKYTFNYAKMLERGTHKHYKQEAHPTRFAKEKYWKYEQ